MTVVKEVNFFAGNSGDVIARINGKVTLIDRKYRGMPPTSGEIWEVEVKEEKERSFIVLPLKRLKTKEEREEEIREKIEEGKLIKEKRRIA